MVTDFQWKVNNIEGESLLVREAFHELIDFLECTNVLVVPNEVWYKFLLSPWKLDFRPEDKFPQFIYESEDMIDTNIMFRDDAGGQKLILRTDDAVILDCTCCVYDCSADFFSYDNTMEKVIDGMPKLYAISDKYQSDGYNMTLKEMIDNLMWYFGISLVDIIPHAINDFTDGGEELISEISFFIRVPMRKALQIVNAWGDGVIKEPLTEYYVKGDNDIRQTEASLVNLVNAMFGVGYSLYNFRVSHCECLYNKLVAKSKISTDDFPVYELDLIPFCEIMGERSTSKDLRDERFRILFNSVCKCCIKQTQSMYTVLDYKLELNNATLFVQLTSTASCFIKKKCRRRRK